MCIRIRAVARHCGRKTKIHIRVPLRCAVWAGDSRCPYSILSQAANARTSRHFPNLCHGACTAGGFGSSTQGLRVYFRVAVESCVHFSTPGDRQAQLCLVLEHLSKCQGLHLGTPYLSWRITKLSGTHYPLYHAMLTDQRDCAPIVAETTQKLISEFAGLSASWRGRNLWPSLGAKNSHGSRRGAKPKGAWLQ